MNSIAILPYIGMHALQIQNVKRTIVKKSSINDLNKEVVHPVDNLEINNTDNKNFNEEGNEIKD